MTYLFNQKACYKVISSVLVFAFLGALSSAKALAEDENRIIEVNKVVLGGGNEYVDKVVEIGSRNVIKQEPILIDNKAHSPFYSVAIGEKNNIDGYASNALGFNNHIIGNSSSALGYNNVIEGNYSSSFGALNKSQGTYSQVLCADNTNTGDKSYILGLGNYNDAYANLSVGSQNNIHFSSVLQKEMPSPEVGEWSTALGFANVTHGQHSMGIGHGNLVNGYNAIVLGGDSAAMSNRSIVIGYAATNGMPLEEDFVTGIDLEKRQFIIDNDKYKKYKESQAGYECSVNLGAFTETLDADSVALGSFSKTIKREEGTLGYDPVAGGIVRIEDDGVITPEDVKVGAAYSAAFKNYRVQHDELEKQVSQMQLSVRGLVIGGSNQFL